MTPQETAQVVAMLSAAFPQWSPSKETVALYHRSLRDLDGELVLSAAETWVLTEERPPTIAGFRQKCAETAGVLAISAQEAWNEVNAIATKYGTYENPNRPRWSSPLVLDAVKSVGYWEICNGNNSTTTRAQFLRAYEELKKKHDQEVVTSAQLELGGNRLALMGGNAVSSNNSATPSLNQGAGK
jgi:hypothetical protein